MKKILKLFIVMISFLVTYQVSAANYTVKELIPIDKQTTVLSDHMSYQGLVFSVNHDPNNKYSVMFTKIKNISEDERPYAVSIALFNEEKKNIGTINFCEGNLASKEERTDIVIKVAPFLNKEDTGRDVKYIAVLGENPTCRTEGALDYVGQTLEEIGIAKNTQIDDDATLTLNVYLVVGAVLLLVFILSFLFTNKYQNVDGDDIRRDYKKYNKQLKDEREYNNRVNPPPVVEPPKNKTDEVKMQEEQAANEDKSGTDLHNLYK